MFKQAAVTFMIKMFAKLPLCVVHFLGTILGWTTYLNYKKYALLINQNLKLSQLTKDDIRFKKTLHRNIAETGKAL